MSSSLSSLLSPKSSFHAKIRKQHSSEVKRPIHFSSILAIHQDLHLFFINMAKMPIQLFEVSTFTKMNKKIYIFILFRYGWPVGRRR
jgi:hypothetical protein